MYNSFSEFTEYFQRLKQIVRCSEYHHPPALISVLQISIIWTLISQYMNSEKYWLIVFMLHIIYRNRMEQILAEREHKNSGSIKVEGFSDGGEILRQY